MVTLTQANKPDAANPAMTSLFHAEHHWRGVVDPFRWAHASR